MSDWQVLINAYGDLPMLREAVASIPDGIPIHVTDGRYETFDGETDLTPGLAEFCDEHPDCEYHEPPEDHQPWPDDGIPSNRTPQFIEARWIYYEAIPDDVWTLKVDTDERLVRFDAPLDRLTDHWKYRVTVEMADRVLSVARLWKPVYWTFWVDDIQVPRGDFSRDAGSAEIRRAVDASGHDALCCDAYDDTVVIENRGHERPDDYLDRRHRQKEYMHQ